MNRYIENRLTEIQKVLMAHYRGSRGLPTAMAGWEREHLVNDYLAQMLPPIYRFGTGAITDADSKLTGQVDVVIEFPLIASFPMPAGKQRLYLAESVAAVIEVKSNLSSQWQEVKKTTDMVKNLTRNMGEIKRLALQDSSAPVDGFTVGPKIPCYAVGYSGYKNSQRLQNRLSATSANSRPDGVLVIDSGLFKGANGNVATGVWGLYAFVAELVAQVNALMNIAHPNMFSYYKDQRENTQKD